MLERLAAAAEVENVVLFVADSVRADALPEPVAAAGTTIETAAPSTFTATSVPSLLTGQYPVGHRVWGFGDQLDRPPALVEGFDTVTCTAPLFGTEFEDPSEKPVFRVLGLPEDATSKRETDTSFPFTDWSSPFCYFEHHHGGHVVYGDPERDDAVHEQSAADYCRRVGRDTARLRADYDRGVAAAGRRFLELRSALADAGLLSETLLVFTSDHGEGLGERGVFTHGAPMVPEVIRVPTVFCGAGLPDTTLDGLASGVDVTPTLLSAAGRDPPSARRVAELNDAMQEAPSTLSDDDVATLKALYRAELHYVDRNLGRLFATLEELGLREETVVAFTADHGEAFGEHDRWGHHPMMYDELLRVPLVIDDPQRPPDTVDTQVSLIDLFPTLCERCGVSSPPETQGEHLFDKAASTELATSQGGERLAARTSDWKLLWHVTEGGVELYDLDDDPEETTDVSDSHPQVVDRLRGELREYRETARDTETELPEVEESEAAKRRLRDLGYTE